MFSVLYSVQIRHFTHNFQVGWCVILSVSRKHFYWENTIKCCEIPPRRNLLWKNKKLSLMNESETLIHACACACACVCAICLWHRPSALQEYKGASVWELEPWLTFAFPSQQSHLSAEVWILHLDVLLETEALMPRWSTCKPVTNLEGSRLHIYTRPPSAWCVYKRPFSLGPVRIVCLQHPHIYLTQPEPRIHWHTYYMYIFALLPLNVWGICWCRATLQQSTWTCDDDLQQPH